jgi:hypothetical protein
VTQIVENWADITGKVTDVSTDPDRDDYVEVELAVDRVENVESWPNLLADKAGTDIKIHMSRAVAQHACIAQGMNLYCRVRRADAAGTMFAHPHHVGSPR